MGYAVDKCPISTDKIKRLSLCWVEKSKLLSTGLQLKRLANLLTVIGLTTKQADHSVRLYRMLSFSFFKENFGAFFLGGGFTFFEIYILSERTILVPVSSLQKDFYSVLYPEFNLKCLQTKLQREFLLSLLQKFGRYTFITSIKISQMIRHLSKANKLRDEEAVRGTWQGKLTLSKSKSSRLS